MNLPSLLFPDAASPQARLVETLTSLAGVGAVLSGTVLLLALLVLLLRRPAAGSDTPRPDGKLLELAAYLLPFGGVLLFLTLGSLWAPRAETPPPAALEINATAKRWLWKFQHPNGKREINDLHVPLGVPVRITLQSEDIAHRFHLPALRLQREVRPGEKTSLWFQTDRPGNYPIGPAGFTGSGSDALRGTLRVVPQTEYQAWVSGATAALAAATPADIGRQLFVKHACNTCHAAADSKPPEGGVRAPPWNGSYGLPRELESGETVVFDDAYIRESIRNPSAKIAKGYQNLMSNQDAVTDTDITFLTAFIKSLRAPDAAPPPPAPDSTPPPAPAPAPEQPAPAPPAAPPAGAPAGPLPAP